MLSGTGLSDNSFLAHLFRKKYLPDGVVDFVGAGMVQVFALEIEPATVTLAHSLGVLER